MIIRPLGTSQLLITQPDHAALAARIMREWDEGGLRESPRPADILLAIAEHDNGWKEVDAAPILDPADGRILDFVDAPAGVKQGVWPRGVERLAGVPYAAALVAQHAIHVYGRFRGDAEWLTFFSTMERARDRHLAAASPAALDDLLADYQFVRVGDLISLAFCNGWTEPQDDGFGRTVRFDGSHVIVEPDPFGGKVVPMEITGREMPARPFASAADARDAFAAAPASTVRGVVSGRP